MEGVSREAEILAQVYGEVERRFTGLDDLAHGWEHVSRVYRLARHIAGQEGADVFVVGMAALLHDLGRAIEAGHDKSVPTYPLGRAAPEDRNGQDVGEHHADVSVRQATDLMQVYQVPAEKQEAILHAIIAHSFSRGVEPRTLEARVVRDADRLDGLGAIGVMRWAVTGTMRRTAQTRSYHPDDPFGESHEPDDTVYILDHFYKKLFKLGETMQTETGRALAQRRTAFMRAYLDEFRSELDLHLQ